MTIWCPKCGTTRFSYEKLTETQPENLKDRIPGLTVIEDKLICKNRSCNYEFKVQWYEYIRSDWINEMKFNYQLYLKQRDADVSKSANRLSA